MRSSMFFRRSPDADADSGGAGVSRRDVLAALLAGAAVTATWTTSSAIAAIEAAGGPAAKRPGLSADEMALLSAAAQVIVPATDTPGAQEAGVPHFVGALVAGWMNDDEAALFRKGLADLDASARARYQRGYAACTPEQGAELLQALRAASPYGGRTFSLTDRILDPKAPFYLRLRDLVVLGYFTSEAGSNQELRYLPVPGKFESNVDIKTWPYQVVI
ncbi:gluconate 2-dehydrogenase subunit 3 family protein [Duganella sp. FT94W]|uniref:Gluconate 2-dehydrogenase subunit 3 family protein n=1 Tax=Duganella lactea TaxID=2692173 RepID=A0ABW9V4M7_9BURK|nr:gluconate 2-dehydrogenase subunit 3 family protein [Duganella lactea]MYM34513.1 gluconate 2-dehydrogenase subunit 3 family protein [Duganella lactea]